ncbi:hypothetical protein [Actinomadura atramentaria]|uniref:hypothetical protein n=1 Tax=Actinomadura atramentaria TaxID=1990 RepID=UPI000366493A|nr:hypothetical protein [Actinomadura atramentaria]
MTASTAAPGAAAADQPFVLCVGEGAGDAARAMLPRLSAARFADVGAAALAAAVRDAAAGAAQVVVIGGFAELADAAGPAGGSRAAVLADVAAAMDAPVPGPGEDARALWAAAGVLGVCGRELCRRVVDRLDAAVAVQVVLVDAAGRMTGMVGRSAPAG